jgi:hypothetical protein
MIKRRKTQMGEFEKNTLFKIRIFPNMGDSYIVELWLAPASDIDEQIGAFINMHLSKANVYKYEIVSDQNIKKEYEALNKPFTRTEIVRGMDDNGYIEGVISISLSSLINSDFENFLDLISELLIGDVCLSDIGYKTVGYRNSDDILLLVSGHADNVADALEDIPDDITVDLPEKFSFKSRQNSLAGDIVYHAEKTNEFADYHVTWSWEDDEDHGIEKFNAKGEDYTKKEVEYFIYSKQWMII